MKENVLSRTGVKVGGVAYVDENKVQVDFDFTSFHIILKYRCPVTDSYTPSSIPNIVVRLLLHY